MKKSKKDYLKEFNEKVKELKDANHTSEEPVYFGYKWLDHNTNTINSVTDWGNIKKFISVIIDEVKADTEKETIDLVRDVDIKTPYSKETSTELEISAYWCGANQTRDKIVGKIQSLRKGEEK